MNLLGGAMEVNVQLEPIVRKAPLPQRVATRGLIVLFRAETHQLVIAPQAFGAQEIRQLSMTFRVTMEENIVRLEPLSKSCALKELLPLQDNDLVQSQLVPTALRVSIVQG